MKKIVSILMALMLVLGLCTACGGETGTNVKTKPRATAHTYNVALVNPPSTSATPEILHRANSPPTRARHR